MINNRFKLLILLLATLFLPSSYCYANNLLKKSSYYIENSKLPELEKIYHADDTQEDEVLEEQEVPEDTKNNIDSNTDNNKVVLSGKILRIAISPVIQPMMMKFADNFHGQINFVKLESEFKNGADGIEKLCYGHSSINVLMMTRKLNAYEKSICVNAAQTNLEELKIGYYGFFIVTNKGNEKTSLSTKSLYKALTDSFGTQESRRLNDNKMWVDIATTFQNTPIRVYGPFVSSPQYDFSVNKISFLPCISDKYLKESFDNKQNAIEAQCKKLRGDGAYIEDNNDGILTVSKISSEKFSYGFVNNAVYQNNRSKFQLADFDGVSPTLENIYNESYSLAFPIYIYIKKSGIEPNNIVSRFIGDIQSTNSIGPNGYLKDSGFIPLETIKK